MELNNTLDYEPKQSLTLRNLRITINNKKCCLCDHNPHNTKNKIVIPAHNLMFQYLKLWVLNHVDSPYPNPLQHNVQSSPRQPA